MSSPGGGPERQMVRCEETVSWILLLKHKIKDTIVETQKMALPENLSSVLGIDGVEEEN